MRMGRTRTLCSVVNIVAAAQWVCSRTVTLLAIAKLCRGNGQNGLMLGALASFMCRSWRWVEPFYIHSSQLGGGVRGVQEHEY